MICLLAMKATCCAWRMPLSNWWPLQTLQDKNLALSSSEAHNEAQDPLGPPIAHPSPPTGPIVMIITIRGTLIIRAALGPISTTTNPNVNSTRNWATWLAAVLNFSPMTRWSTTLPLSEPPKKMAS